MDVLDRLGQSALPESVKQGILLDRLKGHQTGVKGVLADYKAIKQLEQAEREARQMEREEALYRIARGHRLPTEHQLEDEEKQPHLQLKELDDEDDDENFLSSYRERRLAELRCMAALPSFGQLRNLLPSAFYEEVECEDARVFVIIHLFEPSVLVRPHLPVSFSLSHSV